jgi:hypothetical protein
MTPNPASTFTFRRRTVRISNIRAAAILSLILQALLLLNWAPDLLLEMRQPADENKDGKSAGSLAVRLAQPTSRHADEAPMIPRAPAVQAPRMTAARQPAEAPAPRVLARENPATPPTFKQPVQSAPGDLAAYIEARRREREPAPATPSASSPPSPPSESDQERDNRQVAENLGFNRVPTFGTGRMTGGGVFQIASLRYDSAEFFFFGWNKLIRRNAQQMIEVSRGDNASIQLAVVRRMIAIIREQSSTDFIWESIRLRREVALSARPDDNAGLEDFLLKEFFPDYRR